MYDLSEWMYSNIGFVDRGELIEQVASPPAVQSCYQPAQYYKLLLFFVIVCYLYFAYNNIFCKL